MLFFKTKPSDSEIIAGLCAGGSKRLVWENKLYERYFYLIREGMFRHKLTEDEVATAYSDTIIVALENIQSGKFEGKSELKTYIYQIFSNKCVDAVRKKTTNKARVHSGITLNDITQPLPDASKLVIQQLILESEMTIVQNKLKEIGEKCYQLIIQWAEGYADEEIAALMGYHTAQVAKTSRLRCMEKLRELYSKLLH